MEKEKIKTILRLASTVQTHFKNFYLAGGTALMLKHNHRKSYDLDFFSYRAFSFARVSQKVRKIFSIKKEERGDDNIDFFIENIKLSFVFFPFKNIEKLEKIQGIKAASDFDIFLNKIYAAGRRIDWKDPYDCAFLYKIYRWDFRKIKTNFEKKFPGQSFEIFLGALLRFEDYPPLPIWVKKELEKLISSVHL